MTKTACTLVWFVFSLAVADAIRANEHLSESAPDGWTAESPRDEIRPKFSYEADGGPNGVGCLVSSSADQPNSIGRWTKNFPVVGGKHYAFRALRKTKNMKTPRRDAFVRITWQDARGQLV